MNKTVDLLVEAQKDMMLIVRMTTLGVLARAGLTLDDMDDMKMAVDEAFCSLIEQSAGYEQIALHYEYDSDKACVRLSGQGGCRASANEYDCREDEILRCVLESMADEVLIKKLGCSTTQIELKKRCVKAGMAYGC
jgi:anti-sigma regulatory factor (Ser/Thr protein kinase)